LNKTSQRTLYAEHSRSAASRPCYLGHPPEGMRFGVRVFREPRDQRGSGSPPMEKIRKYKSLGSCSESKWPTTVQSVTLFAPTNNAETPVVVYHLNCSDFTVLQIKNVAQAPFEITDLTVNGEFQPTISICSDRFHFLRLPMLMPPGSSFGAVLQTPPRAPLPPDCSYWKAPVSLTIFTDRGYFDFQAYHSSDE